jgi:arsenate reductase
MDKTRVLFICTANSSRSQMAEAFLRTCAGDKYEAYSAGLEARGINPLTKKVMDEIGIDISGQSSKTVQEYMGKLHFGYLITVCRQAEERCPRVFPGIGQRLSWNFEDPAAFVGSEDEKLNKFREVRDQVKKKVEDWIKSQNDKRSEK